MVNLQAFRRELKKLTSVSGVAVEVEWLMRTSLFQTDSDIYDPGNVRDDIRDRALKVSIGVNTLRNALRAIVPKPDETAIRILLPDTNDLRTLINFQSTISTAIEQAILNETIGGKLVIKAWENGSFWLELIVGTTNAVALIGAIAWAAAVVRKKWAEGTLFIQVARGLEIKNNTYEALEEATKRASEMVVDAEANAIFDKYFSGQENHEQIARLKHSIVTFAELMNKGMEVHPSLMTPETAENVFPDFAKLNSVESKIPRLPNPPKPDKPKDPTETAT
jgi:hypothetical protein